MGGWFYVKFSKAADYIVAQILLQIFPFCIIFLRKMVQITKNFEHFKIVSREVHVPKSCPARIFEPFLKSCPSEVRVPRGRVPRGLTVH